MSVLEKVLRAAERNVYYVVVGWNTTMSIWFNAWGSSEVSSLIFYLNDPSIGDSGVFRPPTITVLVSIYTLRAISIFCFFYVDGCPCVWCINVKDWLIVPLDELFLSLIWNDLHCLFWLSLKSTLSDMSRATSAFLWGPFAWKTFSTLWL
jgi:hypothetical protein